MKYTICCLLICIALFSCRKKEPPLPVNGNPIFKFIGTIGGDSVNFQAGVDRMYMYTGFYKDPQNLMTIKSYFGKDNCTNCEPYLSFELKDFDVTNTNGFAGTITDLLNSAGGGIFNSYSLDSILSTTNIEVFSFSPSVQNSAASYKWDFGDGGVSTSMFPNYVFSTGGMKDVRLIFQANGTIPDTLVNQINTDYNATCRAQFNLIQDSVFNQISVNAYPSGLSYLWDFGDGHTGQNIQDTNFYTQNGKYLITLTASGPSCTSVFKQKVNFSPPPLVQKLANFNYQTADSTITAMAPRVNKSAFIITWKKNGQEYKSYKNVAGLNQSGNPVFTFLSVTPYIKDNQGNNTVIITGTVDTYIYNTLNAQDSIKIKSNTIVLAASYPS